MSNPESKHSNQTGLKETVAPRNWWLLWRGFLGLIKNAETSAKKTTLAKQVLRLVISLLVLTILTSSSNYLQPIGKWVLGLLSILSLSGLGWVAWRSALGAADGNDLGHVRRRWWVGLAGAQIITMLYAFMAPQMSNPLASSPSLLTLQWWFSPLQRNPWLRSEAADIVNDFFAAENGLDQWALIGNGFLLHSGDGGRDWKPQFVRNTDMLSIKVKSVAFANETSGVAFGGNERNPFELYSTSDGGRTWTLIDFTFATPGIEQLTLDRGGLGLLTALDFDDSQTNQPEQRKGITMPFITTTSGLTWHLLQVGTNDFSSWDWFKICLVPLSMRQTNWDNSAFNYRSRRRKSPFVILKSGNNYL